MRFRSPPLTSEMRRLIDRLFDPETVQVARKEFAELDYASSSELFRAFPIAKSQENMSSFMCIFCFLISVAGGFFFNDSFHNQRSTLSLGWFIIYSFLTLTPLGWSIWHYRKSERLSNELLCSVLVLRNPKTLIARLEIYEDLKLSAGNRPEFWEGIAASLQLAKGENLTLSREANRALFAGTEYISRVSYPKALQQSLEVGLRSVSVEVATS